jgi:feruloyl-CoA hydratase/lyase
MSETTPAAGTAQQPWGRNVLVEFEDGIAWVTMNRPEKRNAISVDLAREMLATMDALEIDPRCGVFVLTGAGESFSAGMDLKDYFRATDQLPLLERNRIYAINGSWQWRRMLNFGKPTIAMVNGWCFGGAFTPMVACDLAVAANEAKFGLSEINWGIIPAGVVSKAITTQMGLRDSMYYAMTGEPFDGVKAAQMRLVNESVPLAQLRDRVRAIAKTLLGKNPHTLRAVKTGVRACAELTWEQAAEYLTAKSDQTIFMDPERGREKGMRQFLDDKTFRPGLGAYRRGE